MKSFLRLLARDPKGWGTFGIVVLMLLGAIFAPYVAPHSPTRQVLQDRMIPPVFADGDSRYPLGTDYHGRDILSRVLYGARVSLSVGLLAVLLAATVGTILGLIAGYFRGWVDDLLMRFADVMLAFPPIVLGISFLTLFPPNPYLVSVVIALTTWVWFARTVRSVVLRLRQMEFMSAAHAVGATDVYIIFRYLLPNVFPSVIVTASTLLGFAVLLESAFSFFGLSGTTLSWGWDIAQARDFVSVAWWMVTMPGLALFVTIMSLNIFGDYLRDELDPRQRNQRA